MKRKRDTALEGRQTRYCLRSSTNVVAQEYPSELELCLKTPESTSFQGTGDGDLPRNEAKSDSDVAPPSSNITSSQALPQTGLCSLPVEIRLQIWTLCLQYSYDVSMQRHWNVIRPKNVGDKFKNTYFRHRKYRPSIKQHLTLSQVCRLMKREVIDEGLIYKMNTFVFPQPRLLNSFFAAIKPYHMDRISRVNIDFCIGRAKNDLEVKCFETLARCKSLKELNINVFFHQSLCTRHHRSLVIPDSILDIFRKCEGLEKVRGLKDFHMAFIAYFRLPQRKLKESLMLWSDNCPPVTDRTCTTGAVERYSALYNELKQALTRQRDVENVII